MKPGTRFQVNIVSMRTVIILRNLPDFESDIVTVLWDGESGLALANLTIESYEWYCVLMDRNGKLGWVQCKSDGFKCISEGCER